MFHLNHPRRCRGGREKGGCCSGKERGAEEGGGDAGSGEGSGPWDALGKRWG